MGSMISDSLARSPLVRFTPDELAYVGDGDPTHRRRQTPALGMGLPHRHTTRTTRRRTESTQMGVEVAANPQQQAIADALWDNVEKQARAQHDGRRIALTRACDVKVERPVFLHNPLVPTKVLTLIAGRAGVSKSTLSST